MRAAAIQNTLALLSGKNSDTRFRKLSPDHGTQKDCGFWCAVHLAMPCLTFTFISKMMIGKFTQKDLLQTKEILNTHQPVQENECPKVI